MTDIYSNNYEGVTPGQLAGYEYGGTYSRNTVQPKGRDALKAGEELRLGYLTGDTSDSLQLTDLSIEDARQMVGLKPAGDTRPVWLANTGRTTLAELQGVDYPDELSTLSGDWDLPRGY
jgi:hypothetical protein